MWKFVSRRIRDTFERSSNYFDRRSATGINNSPKDCNKSLCCWKKPNNCFNSFYESFKTKNKGSNFDDHLNHNWLSAITWSSALILGWYASKFIQLKHKYSREDKCPVVPAKFLQYVEPILKSQSINKPIKSNNYQGKNFIQSVSFISNDHSKNNSASATSSTSESSDDLGSVLNSIENRLGLSAIESGQYQTGLSLLRSAANRNHAPALFNLGLCHEMGMGVTTNENKAMELYRAAAALEHPSALYNLGIYYGQGRGGLERNYKTAVRLLRLAALKGNEQATVALKTLGENDQSMGSEYNNFTEDDQARIPINSFAEKICSLMQTNNCESAVY